MSTKNKASSWSSPLGSWICTKTLRNPKFCWDSKSSNVCQAHCWTWSRNNQIAWKPKAPQTECGCVSWADSAGGTCRISVRQTSSQQRNTLKGSPLCRDYDYERRSVSMGACQMQHVKTPWPSTAKTTQRLQDNSTSLHRQALLQQLRGRYLLWRLCALAFGWRCRST